MIFGENAIDLIESKRRIGDVRRNFLARWNDCQRLFGRSYVRCGALDLRYRTEEALAGNSLTAALHCVRIVHAACFFATDQLDDPAGDTLVSVDFLCYKKEIEIVISVDVLSST